MVFNIPVVWLHPESKRELKDSKEHHKFKVAGRDCILYAVADSMLSEPKKHEDKAY